VTVRQQGSGILFVISAPSGTGKSTLARAVVERLSGLEFSVSITTRPPRTDERDGHEYHFVDADRFKELIGQNAFLEWAEVYGNLYGTGLEVTRQALREGRDLLLDIDIQGARQVRGGPIPAVSVMILPPDFATLESRLRGRGSENDEELERRLAQAREEVQDYTNFEYLVVNADLQHAVEQVTAIVRAERRRVARCEAEGERIVATFPGRK
jgi:guanylate kinase